MRAGSMVVGAAIFAVLSSAGGTALAQSVETGLEHYQGRWVWHDRGSHDANNVSRIQFTGENAAVYCYNKVCKNVRTKDGAGGSYSFSTNGRDRFEFSPFGGSKMMARYWGAFDKQSTDPTASATFAFQRGH